MAVHCLGSTFDTALHNMKKGKKKKKNEIYIFPEKGRRVWEVVIKFSKKKKKKSLATTHIQLNTAILG